MLGAQAKKTQLHRATQADTWGQEDGAVYCGPSLTGAPDVSVGFRQKGRQVRLARADWGGQAFRALLTLGLGPSAKAPLPLPFDMAVPMRVGRGCLLAALREVLASEAKRVVMPSFVCPAVAEAALVAGGELVFSDIADDLNAETDDLEQLLTRPGVAAIVVPHMFGKPADIKAIEALCRPMGILVIDDAAAAMGIKRNGRYLGTFGDAGVRAVAKKVCQRDSGEADVT